MYFEIEKQAIDAISDALDKFEVDDTLENFQVEDEKNFRLEFPPNPDMGDLASTIAFSLAKKLRKAPDPYYATADQINERVLTWDGHPIVIPYIGNISLWLRGL